MAADIGLIGLGVMGANLALNMAEKGHRVAVFNRSVDKVDAFAATAAGEGLAEAIVPCRSLAELVAELKPPRPVIIMVQAGTPVDEQIEQLSGLLDAGDILIDCGNANFHDTRRRAEAVEADGRLYLGVGVSGGEEGARHGPSIMAGGSVDAWARVEPVFMAIAARHKGEPCCAHLGTDGAGHFVKTIHNGIEYADMQMIADVYGVMRDGLGMEPAAMADVFTGWNAGRLQSYLIEISGAVLARIDDETGKPLIDIILDKAGQKGTGRWSAIEALQLGIPASTIEASVAARNLSAAKEHRVAAEALYGSPRRSLDGSLADPATAIPILKKALLTAKIVAYAQGFDVLDGASRAFGWSLPLATIARIWRAGCIIRSAFLDEIAAVADGDEEDGFALLTTDHFRAMVQDNESALRTVVAAGATSGIPVPALSAALSYLDARRIGRSTANLIQGQRDYFGAHTFERIDKPGAFHADWSGSA